MPSAARPGCLGWLLVFAGLLLVALLGAWLWFRSDADLRAVEALAGGPPAAVVASDHAADEAVARLARLGGLVDRERPAAQRALPPPAFASPAPSAPPPASASPQRVRPVLRAGVRIAGARLAGWYSVGPDGRDDGGDARRDVGIASGAPLGTPRFSDQYRVTKPSGDEEE